MTLPSGAEELAYVAAFSIAAVTCFASIRRVNGIEDADTRRGLKWLLITSAGWGGAHVAYLLSDAAAMATSFHLVGLVFGLATVGPWLYFCSAYTGRRLHRDPRLQRAAVVIFLSIVLLKVTNPIHGVYFSTTVVTSPFQYVAIEYGVVHYIVTGLAYVLAGIGYFMLFELFYKTGQRTTTLGALVTVTGLPVVLNVLAGASDTLVDIGYEPLGVAAFAVGVLYVFAERFEIIRIASDLDTPAIYLDADGRIRDVNPPAREAFPELVDSSDEPLAAALPKVAEARGSEDPVVEGGSRYYRISTNRLTLGQSGVGEAVLLSDVTESEQYRRELERQNKRLNRFASVVSHDLRNPLSVAASRIELARLERDDENLAAAESALDRMEALIDDVLTLARQGESIGRTEAVALEDLVDRVTAAVDCKGATIERRGDLQFIADEDRARQLVENLVRNAIDHGGPDVAIRIGARDDGDGFYVADDGPGIPADKRDDIFSTGFTTADDGTGFGLAIVAEIAGAHGWDVTVSESQIGGARFDVTGVESVWADG